MKREADRIEAATKARLIPAPTEVLTDDEVRVIRKASAEDATAVVELLASFGYEPADLVHVGGALLSSGEESKIRVFVAESEGVVLGVASLSVFDVLERPGPQARLSVIVVDPRARRSEIGRRLVEAVEAEAEIMGCSRVELTSASFLTGAHSFWKSLGYRETGARFVRDLVDGPPWPYRPIEE